MVTLLDKKPEILRRGFKRFLPVDTGRLALDIRHLTSSQPFQIIRAPGSSLPGLSMRPLLTGARVLWIIPMACSAAVGFLTSPKAHLRTGQDHLYRTLITGSTVIRLRLRRKRIFLQAW